MRCCSRLLLLLFFAGSPTELALAGANRATDDRETFFETRIRPVLVAQCVRCHGAEKINNGLRVDARQSLIHGGDSGAAIVPGHPEQSLLLRAMRQADDLKMPPPPARRLPDSVIADFEEWIRDGATWPKHEGRSTAWRLSPAPAVQTHWAFRPVVKAAPPADPSGWSINAVDRFISQNLRARGLKPVPPAPKSVLLRRASFDLIGLPPTPADVRAFVADNSPDAFEKVIDRLLASPQYGERWGRYWMDVVRYADTAGDNADYPVPEARLYRDYIIDSFNADKPYDQFLREQIAGDILAKDGTAGHYAEQVTATGFLALSRRYATAPYELWHLTLEDTIDTVGRACLGITLRCAVPRSQVRSRAYGRLLPAVRHFRQHSFPLCRFRRTGVEKIRPHRICSARAGGGGRSAAGRLPTRDRHRPQRNRSPAGRTSSTGTGGEAAQIAAAPAQGPRTKRQSCGVAGGLRGQRRDRDRCAHSTARRAEPGRGPRATRRAPFPYRLPRQGAWRQRKRAARAGRLDRLAAESAHGPRDGQPRLAASFRPRDRRHPLELRHAG